MFCIERTVKLFFWSMLAYADVDSIDDSPHDAADAPYNAPIEDSFRALSTTGTPTNQGIDELLKPLGATMADLAPALGVWQSSCWTARSSACFTGSRQKLAHWCRGARSASLWRFAAHRQIRTRGTMQWWCARHCQRCLQTGHAPGAGHTCLDAGRWCIAGANPPQNLETRARSAHTSACCFACAIILS